MHSVTDRTVPVNVDPRALTFNSWCLGRGVDPFELGERDDYESLERLYSLEDDFEGECQAALDAEVSARSPAQPAITDAASEREQEEHHRFCSESELIAAKRWNVKIGDKILLKGGDWIHVPAAAPDRWKQYAQDDFEAFADCSDVNLTRRVLDHNPGLVWASDASAWRLYDGSRYRDAAESEVTALFDPFADFLESELPPPPRKSEGRDGPEDPYEGPRKFLSRVKSSARGAALQVVKSRSQRRTECFDQNDRELVFRDVRLDLESGQTKPNGPESFVTKALPWAYAPASAASRAAWATFLNQTGLAPDVVQYIQRGFGAAATGLCSEKAFFYFWGPSGTMKTTFAELITRTLDCYAARCDSKIFMTRRKDTGGHTDDLMDLPAARLVHCDETRDTDRLDSAQIKRMTAGHGRSTLRLSAKGEKGRPVTIKFLVVFTSEQLARVDCDDKGLHARQKIVRFERVLSESEKDPRFVERNFDLLRPAIVEWLVEGARQWLTSGLGAEPEAIRQAGDENRKAQDWLLGIVDELFELTDSDADRIPYEQIEAKIQAYLAVRKRRETFTPTKLGRVLTSAGFERDPDTKARKRIRLRRVAGG
jgi:P4 family phage/plasmid primase-like protien